MVQLQAAQPKSIVPLDFLNVSNAQLGMIAAQVIQFLAHRDNITMVHNVQIVPPEAFVLLEATRKLHVQLVISVLRGVLHRLCVYLERTPQLQDRSAVQAVLHLRATLAMATQKLFVL